MKPKVVAVLVLLMGCSAFAQNQLNVVARCLSFQLQPSARTVSGYGTVTTYFSTYDGRDDILPLSTYTNGLYYFSGEMRPLGGGTYAVDYISFSSLYGYIEDGYFTASLPATDADGNGVPDWSDTPNAPVLKLGYTTNSKTITLTGQPNHKYTTYYSTDLKNWQLVADLEIVSGTNKISFNHGTTDGRGFYRATFP